MQVLSKVSKRPKSEEKNNNKKVTKTSMSLEEDVIFWLLCNVTRSLQPLRKHTAKSTKKQTIVLKGKRYKAQWWSSNYTVDPH